MLRRWGVPALAVTYYAAMVAFVTYPGYVPFNEIRPFVLGMPFSLFWQVLWICGAILMLATVFVWERRRRGRTDEIGTASAAASSGEAGDDDSGHSGEAGR